MRRCWECIKDQKVLCFIAGAAAVIFGKQLLKSDCARKACVGTMAKAMKFQNDAQEAFQNMKEDAEDICYDAKKEAEMNEEGEE